MTFGTVAALMYNVRILFRVSRVAATSFVSCKIFSSSSRSVCLVASLEPASDLFLVLQSCNDASSSSKSSCSRLCVVKSGGMGMLGTYSGALADVGGARLSPVLVCAGTSIDATMTESAHTSTGDDFDRLWVAVRDRGRDSYACEELIVSVIV